MKKILLLTAVSLIGLFSFAQNTGFGETEIIDASKYPEGTIITSIGINDTIVFTQPSYPSDNEITGYIVQLTLPPFNAKAIIKMNNGKSNNEKRASLQAEMQLLKVFHDKFKKDLRKIEKKLHILMQIEMIIHKS